ncbi:MAG TPA: hypothetical protein DCW68_07725 [Rhodospirillaceae bacterium]|nr:MAG: hypothetical protein A2018_08055 [Alphaproteobacteria bacterium GWF2_58_20]HAU29976.1 hypothetical protein [Rhodospirillaceae bacterium]
MSIATSNIGQTTHMNALLRNLRGQMSTAQSQLASGLKSESFSGLGTDATISVSMRGDLARMDTYISSINTALGNTEIMDKAVNNMTSSARAVLTTLVGQLRGGDAVSESVNISAANALDSIQNLINTSLNGRLLFAGDAIESAPMADEDALNTNIQAEMAAWQAGTQDAATTIANIDAFSDTDIGLSGGLAAAGGTTVRVDDNLTVDYTIKANNDGFKDIMKGLAIIENLEYKSNDVEGYWALYDSAMGLIDSGSRALDVDVANLALASNAMDDAASRHEETKVVMDKMIGQVEDVDTAEILTRLQNMQTQLEISYRIISSMQETSLVNYL